MAARRAVVAVVLGLCLLVGVVHGYEAEAKPNNYPGFKFVPDGSGVKSTASETTGNEFTVANAGVSESKPNNYPNFQYTDSSNSNPNTHQFAANSFSDVPDDRSHESYYAQDTFVFKAQETGSGDSFSTVQHSGTGDSSNPDVLFSTDVPQFSTEVNGDNSFSSHTQETSSDPNSRYPSGYPYHMVSSQLRAQRQDESSSTLNVAQTNTEDNSFSSRSQATSSDPKNRYPSGYPYELQANTIRSQALHGESFTSNMQQSNTGTTRTGSTRFYTPSTDPDFAFRFAMPNIAKSTNTFGDNSYKANDAVDHAVYSQYNHDSSASTHDPTVTHGSTSTILASNNVAKSDVTASQGCANMYWAEHPQHWPSFFKISTPVSQAFGTKAGDIFGTTTMLQALYDTRPDGYSKLLSQGTASLLNAYMKPNYALRHDAVIEQFNAALASRTAAATQAQKFENENHAYGPNECAN